MLNQYNLLDKYPVSKSFHIVRAMNILNVNYFSRPEFKLIITHIFDSLADGGLFITGSNQNSSSLVHGGIFLKTQSKYKKIYGSGEGSYVEELICNYTDNN